LKKILGGERFEKISAAWEKTRGKKSQKKETRIYYLQNKIRKGKFCPEMEGSISAGRT